MSNINTAKMTALTNGQKFLKANPDALKDIVTFKTESDELDSNVSKAQAAIKLLGKIATVTAKDVTKYKNDMSRVVLNLAKNALVKSKQLGNVELENTFTFLSDFILGSDKVIAVQKAEAIVAAVVLNSTLLVNILPEAILAANTSITLYDTMKDVPEMSIKNKKSFGNAILKESLKAGRGNINNMKLLMDANYPTDSEYKKAFYSAVVVEVLGVRHTPTNITPVDAETGLVIDNVVLEYTTKKGVKKTFLANEEGVVPFKTHKAGATTYTAKRTGYPDTLVTVNIVKRKTNDITVVMKK